MLESIFRKLAGLQACKFIKKKLQHRCFPVNIAKYLRTLILMNIYEWLLLSPPDVLCKKMEKFCKGNGVPLGSNVAGLEYSKEHALFLYKQHFYNQRQAKIGKNLSKS